MSSHIYPARLKTYGILRKDATSYFIYSPVPVTIRPFFTNNKALLLKNEAGKFLKPFKTLGSTILDEHLPYS
jgi:hypothetical protein